MADVLTLASPDGPRRYRLAGEPVPATPGPPPRSRVAYAAVHVVADPLRAAAEVGGTVDWDATLAFRRTLWSLGLGVAEAMDTAQRGMGLDWPTARELIARSLDEARQVGGRIVCGASTDQLPAGELVELPRIRDAYLEQIDAIEGGGGHAVIMASRALAASAGGADDYVRVYDEVLAATTRPVVLHWLGPAFDPALTGYWGSTDLREAAEVLLEVIKRHEHRVEGVKISCLDLDLEVDVRRRLPAGVRIFTGDDFNYLELIAGDGEHSSDALLGILSGIAPAGVDALRRLDAGDADGYRERLAPTVPLSRHIFGAPTRFYKTGLTLLAWLNGHQDHFRMLDGRESARSVEHLCELFVLADWAGALEDPPLAVRRMGQLLAVAGIAQ